MTFQKDNLHLAKSSVAEISDNQNIYLSILRVSTESALEPINVKFENLSFLSLESPFGIDINSGAKVRQDSTLPLDAVKIKHVMLSML